MKDVTFNSTPPTDYVPVGPFYIAKYAKDSDEGSLLRGSFSTKDAAFAQALEFEATSSFEFEVVDSNLYTLDLSEVPQ